MAVSFINNWRSTLRLRLLMSDTALAIPRADAIRLNAVGVGNYTYLTIRDRTRSEIVRYDHTADWDSSDQAVVQLPVIRDADAQGSKNFAYGACVVSEMNGLYIEDRLRELVAPVPGVLPPTTEQPELPTTMVGGRTQILGKPAGYWDIGGKNVPYYDP